jgi:hypothetical protein
MKKLILILLVLGTMSCNVMKYEPKFTIGMTELEFKQLNKSAMQVYGDEQNVHIYRTFNAYSTLFKFFVFSKEKLVKFEEGKELDDYKYISLGSL